MKARAETLVQGGVALSHDENGRILFIDGALPGEEVEVSVDKRTPDYTSCHVENILCASPDRVFPKCPFYGECGGCNLQMLSDGAQPEVKENLVRENLRRVAGIDAVPMDEMATGPMWGYRLRTRFHVDLAKKEVGYLGRKSNRLVPVDDCPILEKELNVLLKDKRQLLEQARKLMFLNKGKDGLFEVPVISGKDGLSFGEEVVHVDALSHCFAVSASVFFQGNRFVLPSMGQFVRDEAVGERVMDLYSGVGTFSAFVGKREKNILVEREPRCLSLARLNVPFGSPFSMDVAKWKGKEKVDTVIVDPPRGGLLGTVPSLIASWEPDRVIYMSCNTVTLARDAARFIALGYVPVRLKVFDLYPQTFEQEACLVFDRKEKEA
jgi:23S rRNA (uracil1939-C5)-methyltransferase